MPFVDVNVKEQIEKKRQNDPEFRKAWDESHNEIFKDTMTGLLEAVEIEKTDSKEKISSNGMSFDDYLKENYAEDEIKRIERHSRKMYNRHLRRMKKWRKKQKEINKKLKIATPLTPYK